MPETRAPTVPVAGRLVSVPVTVDAVARWDGVNLAAVVAVAGRCRRRGWRGRVLLVQAANGDRLRVPPGYWVVRYGLRDTGVLSDGAYCRFFGEPPARPEPAGMSVPARTVTPWPTTCR